MYFLINQDLTCSKKYGKAQKCAIRIFFLLQLYYLFGCKAYRNLENINFRSSQNIQQDKNLSSQLDFVKPGKPLQLIFKNGEREFLIYYAHSTDSIQILVENPVATNNPKEKFLIKSVAFNEIKKIKIARFSIWVTVLVPLGMFSFFYYYYNH